MVWPVMPLLTGPEKHGAVRGWWLRQALHRRTVQQAGWAGGLGLRAAGPDGLAQLEFRSGLPKAWLGTRAAGLRGAWPRGTWPRGAGQQAAGLRCRSGTGRTS